MVLFYNLFSVRFGKYFYTKIMGNYVLICHLKLMFEVAKEVLSF